MSKFKLLYKQPAVKDIKSLSPQTRKRLVINLEFFIAQANPLDFAKPLTKPADTQCRYLVGDYRVLLYIEDHNIIVLRVQHCREVYQR